MVNFIITSTKNRPNAFNKLAEYVKKQSDHWNWLVVTDGDTDDYKFPKKAIVLESTEEHNLPLVPNMATALKYCVENKVERVLVMDDDDYYCPTYCSEIYKMLDQANIVGFHDDAHYHAHHRLACRFHNIGYAALGATAFNAKAFGYIQQCIDYCLAHKRWDLDMFIWHGIPFGSPFKTTILGAEVTRHEKEQYSGKKLLFNNFNGINFVSSEKPRQDKMGNNIGTYPRHVAIKGNWHNGQAGLTQRHDQPAGANDVDGHILTEWLAENARFYLNLTKPVKLGTPGVIFHLSEDEIE